VSSSPALEVNATDVTVGATVRPTSLDVVVAVAPSAVAVTTTRYLSPLSFVLEVEGVVYEARVAPLIFDHEARLVDSAFCH
jgi:hypothetical protein